MIGNYIAMTLLICAACLKQDERQIKEQKFTDERPNIVLIVAESHRAEALGAAGHPFVKTPHLDSLANQGVIFDHAYVTTAICSVSRASLLTGQHRARHGINDFTSSLSAEAFQETLPMVLRKIGYALAWVGPYGVGSPPSTKDFDDWQPSIPWLENGVHHTDNAVQKAAAWLEGNDRKQPFYLQLNFNAAHEIDPTADHPAHYIVQERFRHLYEDIHIPQPKSADSNIWEGFPAFFKTDQNIARKRWCGFFSSDELFQKNAKDYYRLISGLDDAVGTIRAKLQQLGLDKNTIVIYTTDHGFSLGEHGLMGKWYGYDVGIHVPLLIYDPRNINHQGIKAHNIALNIDIAPTILGLAGVPAPSRMQGVNLMDVLDGKLPERKDFFYEHTVFSSPALPKVEGIVSKRYKYMKYIEHDYEMLYDLGKDPEETVNVVTYPDYAIVLEEMRRLYKEEKVNAR